MRSICTALALVLAAALTLLPVAVDAQTPASTPPAAAKPGPAFSASRVVADGVTSGDKACNAAGHRLAREQKSLATAQVEVARYTKLQHGCGIKSVCARYAAALESLDKRIARHTLRIDKFAAARDAACKS